MASSPDRPDRPDRPGGIEFVPIVTLGNIFSAVALVIPLIIWGIRLEGRVDHEADLRARNEKTMSDMAADSRKRDENIDRLLEGIRKDVTEIRVSLSTVQGRKAPTQ